MSRTFASGNAVRLTAFKSVASLTLVLALFAPRPAAQAADGYANVGGTTTGGGSGPTVTVTTLAQLTSAASDDTARNVRVSGTINLGSSNFRVGSNKTITGVGANSGFNGDLICRLENNIILQNLRFTNPSSLGDADGLTLYGSTHVFVTHCTFTQCGDGSLDITHGSDNITVSWCRFLYTSDTGHNFVNLIGHSDNNASEDTGRLHITMHHNWYSTLCKERMPRVRFGRVHVYNNYYGSAGNNYNVGLGNDSQVLLETCYFDSQSNGNTWKNYSSSGHQGLIHWDNGSVFVNTAIATWAPNSSVFSPPYSRTLTAGSSVKSVVTNASTGAGTH
jgi:pectate lyase